MSASNLLSQDKAAADRKAYEPSMEEILASIRRIIADDQAFAGTSAEASEPEPDAEDVAVAAEDTAVEPAAVAAEPAPQPAAPPQPPKWNGDVAFVPLTPGSRAEAPKPVERAAEKPAEPAAQTRSYGDLRGQSDTSWMRPAVRPLSEPRAARQPEPPAAAPQPAEPRPEPAKTVAEPPRRPAAPVRPAEPAAETPLVSAATDQAVSSAFNALVASRLVQSHESMEAIIRDMLRPMLKAWLDDNLPIMVERLVRAEIERVARGGR